MADRAWTRTGNAGTTSSSSRAWARAASLPGWPESMRESSVTRSSPATAVAPVTVRPRASRLDDADLRVGLRGHLGQVGDDQHLAVRAPPRAAPRPRASAAAPPTPASTSSKTIVCGPPRPTRRMASMARASSPPEATRASGWRGSPTLAPEQQLTGSPAPVGGHLDLEPGPGHGQAGQPLPRPPRRRVRRRHAGRARRRPPPRPARPGGAPARPPGGPPRPRRPRGRPAGPRPLA